MQATLCVPSPVLIAIYNTNIPAGFVFIIQRTGKTQDKYKYINIYICMCVCQLQLINDIHHGCLTMRDALINLTQQSTC